MTCRWSCRATASRLRMACTRQRCQPEFWNTRRIAALSPACASEMTSLTPARPRSSTTAGTRSRTSRSRCRPRPHRGPHGARPHADGSRSPPLWRDEDVANESSSSHRCVPTGNAIGALRDRVRRAASGLVRHRDREVVEPAVGVPLAVAGLSRYLSGCSTPVVPVSRHHHPFPFARGDRSGRGGALATDYLGRWPSRHSHGSDFA
jgi:hypothetical protein